ncbi:hypothetical protein F4824DRAFT_446776 [Ustulina deusta]|nr:hypothetical protein F4824DRAFT_446776 [Ustulina deusta]
MPVPHPVYSTEMLSTTHAQSLPPANGDDRGPDFRVFIIVVLILSVTAVSLRLWSRSLGKHQTSFWHKFWWDDWVALAAVPTLLAQFSIIFYMLSLGLGRHIDTLPAENIEACLFALFIVYFIYDFTLFLTKASALFFYSRVFVRHTHTTRFRYALWIVHFLNLSWLLGITFGTIFMCNPVAKGYQPDLPGTCGPIGALWVGSAIPSVIIDLIILLLPVPKIWGLEISLAKKSGITVVFALGYSVIVVSLGRLITVIKSADALSRDLTYEGVPALYWLCAESPITLVSICLPATLSLGRHLMNSYFIPLSSRVISLVSSKKGSTGSLGEGRSNHRGPGGSRFDAFRRLKEVRGWNSFAYAEGVSIRSEIPLVPATLHGQEYEAETHSDGSSHNKDSTQLGGAIHVGKSFDVSHHDKGA